LEGGTIFSHTVGVQLKVFNSIINGCQLDVAQINVSQIKMPLF